MSSNDSSSGSAGSDPNLSPDPTLQAATLPRHAVGPDEAERRFEKWHSVDPYPEIPPALLNSADIQDYVSATGMINPFYPEPGKDKLKAASYEVDLLGEYVYYDATGSERSDKIERGQAFVLEANSIAFVTLEPYFRLPDYIALRFNLRITHIYRGLLLGTGPLVDPGFRGRLSIPLHNLTTNDYRLVGGEGLIWVEFTKVSPFRDTAEPPRNPDAPPRQGVRYANKGLAAKSGSGVKDYLRKAEPHRPIQSGIPAATRNAEGAAREAQATTRTFRNIAALAAFAFIVGLASLFIGVLSLLHAVNTRVDNLNSTSTEVAKLQAQLEDLQRQLDSLPAAGAAGSQASPAAPPSSAGSTP